MNNSTTPYLNLLPRAYQQQRVEARWTHRWIAAAVVTTLAIGIPGVYIGGAAAMTESGISDQIQNAKLENTENLNAIPLLSQRIKQLSAQEEVLELIKNRLEWRDVFSILVDAAGNDVRFRHLSAVGGGVDGASPIQINIEGYAPTQTIAREYMVDLESIHVFDSIELIKTERVKIEETELIRFQVLITVDSVGMPTKEDDHAG